MVAHFVTAHFVTATLKGPRVILNQQSIITFEYDLLLMSDISYFTIYYCVLRMRNSIVYSLLFSFVLKIILPILQKVNIPIVISYRMEGQETCYRKL